MARRAHMNLPNTLSVTRIFLVPLLVVVLLTKFEGRMILVLALDRLVDQPPLADAA